MLKSSGLPRDLNEEKKKEEEKEGKKKTKKWNSFTVLTCDALECCALKSSPELWPVNIYRIYFLPLSNPVPDGPGYTGIISAHPLPPLTPRKKSLLFRLTEERETGDAATSITLLPCREQTQPTKPNPVISANSAAAATPIMLMTDRRKNALRGNRLEWRREKKM